MDKKQPGGKREGAGRKAKDPTKVLPFRVPADKAKELKPIIEACIKNFLNPSLDTTPIITKPTIRLLPKKESPKRFNLSAELEKLRIGKA
jgi:hypothetical protein